MTTPDAPSAAPPRTGWTPGGPFGFTDEGAGPTFVLLHGLPGSGRDFRWLAPALTGWARVVRIDQPGFGGTPIDTDPDPTLEGRARFVQAALAALGLEEVTLIGHSIAGPVAMAVAGSNPRVRRLGLLASVGLHPHRLARASPRHPAVARLLERPIVARALAPTLRRNLIRAGFPRSTPDAALIQTMRVYNVLSFEEVRAAARAVRCETLVAWAEDDRLVEPAVALALGDALPPGPRLGYAEGGHNLQKTMAVELAAALRAWVA
jgi:pimeloyl-ACP methyl ester carboxylesterase